MALLERNGLCLMIFLSFILNASLVSAQEDYTVTIGKNKEFTTSNYWNTDKQIGEAISEGQTASTHVYVGKYQSGFAKSWNGVNFAVKADEYGNTKQEAIVTITFDYQISVNFQVPPPEEGGGGSVDAIVYGILPGSPPQTVERINFIHNSNSDTRSGTRTLSGKVMLEADKSYEILTHAYSFGDVYIDGFADSNVIVTVKEIKITFIPEFSYIVVHTLNPEGVEINSIPILKGLSGYTGSEGSLLGIKNPIRIYVDDTFIGYGCCSGPRELNHNSVTPILPGKHTIKAVFNDISKEKVVQLNPGDTENIIFIFERTEFDIKSWIESMAFDSTLSLEKHIFHDTNAYDWDLVNGGESECIGGPCESYYLAEHGFSYHADPSYPGVTDVYLKFISTFQFNSNSSMQYMMYSIQWDGTSPVNVNAAAGSYCGGDVPKNFFEPTSSFNRWYIQSIRSNWYPSIGVYSEKMGFRYRLLGDPSLFIHSNVYIMEELPASENFSFIELDCSNPSIYDSVIRSTSGNFNNELIRKGSLDEVKMSSVPYDILGLGTKDEINPPPKASFTYSPEELYVNEVITFDGSSSSDPDGSIDSYVWDFGDGNSAEGKVVPYTYTKKGEYTVTLTVKDNGGLTNSVQKNIIINAIKHISTIWQNEKDEMIVPYDKVELKFTFKNLANEPINNVKLSFNKHELLSFEQDDIFIDSIKGNSEFSVVNSIRIKDAGNDRIFKEIIDKVDNSGKIELKDSDSINVKAEYGSNVQEFAITPTDKDPTDEEHKILFIQYPDFRPKNGDSFYLKRDDGFNYYFEGDTDFSHTKETLVRKYALVAAATDPNTGEISVFPDEPEKVAFNVFRYVDKTLDPDITKTNFNNDLFVVQSLESQKIIPIEPKNWICIAQAYLFTSFERTLGFPSREVTTGEGVPNWQLGNIVLKVKYIQNAAAQVWYNNKWNFYDPFTSRTDPVPKDRDILDLSDLFENNLPIVKYKAWYAFDKQVSRNYFDTLWGHSFRINETSGKPKNINEWAALDTATKRGYIVLAASPLKMLLKNNLDRMIGSTDLGIVNNIQGATYMPPGQIGYSDMGDPSTAFELDEFIFLPDNFAGKYELNIKGTGDGEYHLQFAKFDATSDNEFSGVTTFADTIKKDQVRRYEVSIDGSSISAVLPVAIDIKPGSLPNSINLRSEGSMPVAILSDASFDARTVNVSTIALAGAPVKLKKNGMPMVSIEDVNGDRLLDMIVHVDTKALQLIASDNEAMLEGKTVGGTPIRGKDSIRIVPK